MSEMNESLLKLMQFGFILLFFVVRAVHHRRAENEGGKIEYREKNFTAMRLFRQVGSLVMLGALAAYFVAPQWVAWASFPLPTWGRWAGILLGYLSLPLLWWIERTLGLNFNVTLHLRDGHTLVTSGPYRWVRHPMYTALFLFTLAWLLASANWLVGLPGLVGLSVIVLNRIKAEEAVMLERFGEQYHAYMQRTGRFLPRLSR